MLDQDSFLILQVTRTPASIAHRLARGACERAFFRMTASKNHRTAMHRCIKLNFTVRGKHFETDTKNCCACGKEFDGHLKEVLHQGSMNKMRAWIVAMRKEAITMNVNNYHQGSRGGDS